MVFIEHRARIINQILTCRQNPADRIAQVVCRNLEQLHWIKSTIFMPTRGVRVLLPWMVLMKLVHFVVTSAQVPPLL